MTRMTPPRRHVGPRTSTTIVLSLVMFAFIGRHELSADDWPMFGRNATRNAVSDERHLPTIWHTGKFDRGSGKWLRNTARNIRWVARLGTFTHSDPVVADGLVWIGTNNQVPRDRTNTRDGAALMCFRESDGKFLWQHLTRAPKGGPSFYWTISGHATPPLIQDKRLWFTTIRGEVLCLDIGPLRKGTGVPRVVWSLDMPKTLGVRIRAAGMGDGRVAAIAGPYRGKIFVATGNGVGADGKTVPAPHAPSFVCLDQGTGQILWKDNSPGKNILFGQWGTPTVIEVKGRGQVVVPQGDGWLRSFDALTGKLIWKFDLNFKRSKWELGGRGTRNLCMSAPTYYSGKIYVATGLDWESGDGAGRLVCLDPTRSGDISSELAVDGHGRLLQPRRIQTVDSRVGEKAVANPNSGLIWEFAERGKEFAHNMHRTMSTVAISQGLVIAPDFSGLVHCLDAATGKRLWAYDTLADIHGSPLIVDGKVFVANSDGVVSIFRLSRESKKAMPQGKPLAKIVHESGFMSSPVFANGTLYIATTRPGRLFAIAGKGARRSRENKSAKLPLPNSDKLDRFTERVRKKGKNRSPDAIYVPTPRDVVAKMLKLASVTKADVVCDLGSGDGRFVIAAAKTYGCKAIGYEIDPELVKLSKEKIKRLRLGHLARIEHEDIFTRDLSGATVITVFLYPRLMKRLLPQFNKLKRGSRIVSHHFAIPGVRPDKVVYIKSKEDGDKHRIYLWTVPLKLSQDD